MNEITIRSMKDDRFYSLFRQSRWTELDDRDRLAVLQEAARRAQVDCRVQWADLPQGVSGSQAGDVIHISRDVYAQGHDCYSDGTPMNGAGFRALQTVLHESRHAYQDAAIHGRVEADPELVQQWRCNDFAISDVEVEGRRVPGLQYLSGGISDEEYYLYRAQPLEHDAFSFSEEKTQQIVKRQQAMLGLMPPQGKTISDLIDIAAFQDDMLYENNAQVMKEACEDLGDEKLVQNVANTLCNAYYGDTSRSVSEKSTQEAVHRAMHQSYNEFLGIQEENSRSIDPGMQM